MTRGNRTRRASLLCAVACLSIGCDTWTVPFDYAINLGTFPHDPALKAPDDTRRVVVLRHGLSRSAAALWKLDRALRDHGYLTFNTSYDSTRGSIEGHAAQLHVELEDFLQHLPGPEEPFQIFFVGHSMGGLQIRHYLTLAGARTPDACLFLGTPHRGAALLAKRKGWWLFKTLMREQAALQLEVGHPFYDGLGVLQGDFGVIYGGYGDGVGRNADVPGDDDGTVSVEEAQLPGAVDSIRLPLSHMWLTIDDSAIHQVLSFLRHRRFDHR